MANQVLYGFTQLKDVFGQRVSTVGVDVVSRAIQASVAEHNRQIDAMLTLFAKRTTEFKVRYKTPAAARLQPIDENGRARPIKSAGYYDISFPLQMGATAWGANFVSRAKMTVQEANDQTATLIMADIRWVRDHILAALYTNASWSFVDEDKGTLTIKGLANSDTDTYLIQAGADAGATDTHYLAQAAAIADGTNPYPSIYSELAEHPENGGEVVALIPTDLKATTEALTNFVELPDANIQPGSATARLVGNLGVSLPGKLLGYVDKVWVAEWKALPSNYIVATMTDAEPPLAMREDVESSLRGFNMVAERNDHPFYESQWIRRAGFGAYNRVGALVYRVGDAAYAIPTNYSSPMA